MRGVTTADQLAPASQRLGRQPVRAPRISPRLRRPILMVSLGLAGLLLLGTWRMLLSDGVPIWGDFPSWGRSYARQAAAVWNTLQYGGTVNYDLRIWPWATPLGMLAGTPGSGQFALVNRLFVAASIAVPLFVGTFAAAWLVRDRSWRRWAKALSAGIVLAGNPWSVAQIAAGHPTLVIGLGLLPAIVVVAIRGNSWRFQPLLLGLLLAAEASLSFQAAALAAVVAIAYLSWKQWRQAVRTLALAGLTAAVATSYWTLPLLMALRSVPAGGSLGSTQGVTTSTIASLSQLGDIPHVLGARSFWWRPFSDELYRFPAIGDAVGILLALSFAGVIALTWRRLMLGDAVLVGLGILPQLLAHASPPTYAALARIPILGLFIDPSYFTLLYLVVIWRAIALLPLGEGETVYPAARAGWRSDGHQRDRSPASPFWQGTAGALLVVAVLATALPWSDGQLRGSLQTTQRRTPLVRALHWVNRHLRGTTLWLPVVPYVRYQGHLTNDPVRFWSSTPVANSYSPPYYDSSPTYSSSLLDFEYLFQGAGSQRGDIPLLRSTVGSVLARAGLAGLVVRESAMSSEGVQQLVEVLRDAAGVHPVARFGGIAVYEVADTPRGRAWTTSMPALVDSGWYGLSLASIGGVPSEQTLLPLYQDRIDPLIRYLEQDGTPIPAVLSGPWDLVFARDALQVPPEMRRRPWYMFDGLTGYEVEPRESVYVPSAGVAAFQVVGGAEVDVRCRGTRPTLSESLAATFAYGSEEVVTTEASAGRRWLAIACKGLTEVQFSNESGQWLVGSVSLSVPQFEQRVQEVAGVMSRPGSAYVFPAADSYFTEINGRPALASPRSSPAWVDAGRFRFEAKGGPECTPGRGFLWPSGGDPISFRLTESVDARSASVRVPSGAYQLLLRGAIESCSALILRPAGDEPRPSRLTPLGFAGLAGTTHLPRARGLLYRGNGGPWSVSTSEGSAPAFRANALETWYPITGNDAVVDPGVPRNLSRILVASLAAIGVALLLKWRLGEWSRRRRGRASRARLPKARLSPSDGPHP